MASQYMMIRQRWRTFHEPHFLYNFVIELPMQQGWRMPGGKPKRTPLLPCSEWCSQAPAIKTDFLLQGVAFLTITPIGFPVDIMMRIHAVGAFWGLVNSTDALSASGSMFQYRMSS